MFKCKKFADMTFRRGNYAVPRDSAVQGTYRVHGTQLSTRYMEYTVHSWVHGTNQVHGRQPSTRYKEYTVHTKYTVDN